MSDQIREQTPKPAPDIQDAGHFPSPSIPPVASDHIQPVLSNEQDLHGQLAGTPASPSKDAALSQNLNPAPNKNVKPGDTDFGIQKREELIQERAKEEMRDAA